MRSITIHRGTPFLTKYQGFYRISGLPLEVLLKLWSHVQRHIPSSFEGGVGPPWKSCVSSHFVSGDTLWIFWRYSVKLCQP